MNKSEKLTKCMVSRRPGAVCDHPFCRDEATRLSEGRPHYDKRAFDIGWSRVEAHGTTAAKLIFALMTETPLMAEEIATIALDDVCVEHRELLVRTQRTITARWVTFGEKTEKYLGIWLAERDGAVKHGRLLHQVDGQSFKGSSLRMEVTRATRAADEAEIMAMDLADGTDSEGEPDTDGLQSER